MRLSVKGIGSRKKYVLAASAILLLGASQLVLANEGTIRVGTANRDAQQISLVVGKSTVVDVPVQIKRASLADPQIADAIVLSPKQIYVTGKGYGTTNLTLWGKDDQVLAIFDLDVGIDLVRLKQHLGELLPDETNIHLRGTHDHVTISGTVSSEGRLQQVMTIAEAYAPKKVLNFLKVYPEPLGNPAPDVRTVTVEVIKGTSVGSVKF
ncbi:MAG TPA: pilus assembly protein N-terminal domain-containing protein [Nitrospira sp.]|nr:pilus assembly protein N-terminal domain-containing protein [Nitrospira sp.]